MPPGKDWIRVDITRHLECVPRMKLKDIIAVKKCIPNQDTVDSVAKVADVDTRPLSNTVKGHEQAVNHFSNGQASHSSEKHAKMGRANAGGSWINSIMKVIKPVWNTVATGASFMGPQGRAISAGMNAIGTIGGFGNDSMTGAIR